MSARAVWLALACVTRQSPTILQPTILPDATGGAMLQRGIATEVQTSWHSAQPAYWLCGDWCLAANPDSPCRCTCLGDNHGLWRREGIRFTYPQTTDDSHERY